MARESANCNDFSGQIIRSVRKYNGISQLDLASILNIPQPTLSKIERGYSEINALNWALFCEKFNVTPSSLFSGFVDLYFGGPGGYSGESDFKIPKKYNSNKWISVRFLVPLVEEIKEKLGEDFFKTLTKSFKIDVDFFNVLNNKINYNFLYDFLEEINQKVDLTSFLDVKSYRENIHGHLNRVYDLSESALDNVLHLSSNFKHYEEHLEFDFTVDENEYQASIVGFEKEYVTKKNLMNGIHEMALNYRVEFIRNFQCYGDHLASLDFKKVIKGNTCQIQIQY